MKASVRARLARLEDAARSQAANNHAGAREKLLAKLESMAEQPRDRPLERMSLVCQAAYAIFAEVTRVEAEEVAARFEARAADIPGLEGLARVIRARIVAENRNEGRAAIGLPLLETRPKS